MTASKEKRVVKMLNPNKLYWIKREIVQIENQIKELTVLSAVAMDSTSGGHNVSSPVERFYIRLEKLKSRLADKHAESLAEQERLENFIDTIEDAEIRVFARSRYIENKSFQQIGDENYVDRTTVAKKLRRYVEGRKTDE